MTMRIYLHSEISSAQASHGISQDDYAQYAAYCTRRLARLRHGKAVKKELLHCRMYKNALSTRRVHTEGGATPATAAKEGSKARHAYRAIDLSNLPSETLESHVNYFLEPLYCAERCWAASMSIKAEGDQIHGSGSTRNGGGALRNFGGESGNSKKNWSPGKIRAHAVKRMRKAVKFATLLETLTTSTKNTIGDDEENGDAAPLNTDEVSSSRPPVDAHTQMEARAYASWMKGNLALEQNQWQVACNEYQTALTLYEALAAETGESNSAGGDDSNDGSGAVNTSDLMQLELFDFFTTRAQNVIAPLLRYCHYELQDKGMAPTGQISSQSTTDTHHPNDPLQSKSHSLKAQTLQSKVAIGSMQIVFRENTIAVESKELKIILLKVEDLMNDWEKSTVGKSGRSHDTTDTTNARGESGSDAKFMALLNGYDDALSLANHELKQLATLKSGPAVNAKKFQLVHIVGYCKYQKLKLVMGRNEALISGILLKNTKKGITLKHLEEVAHLYDALLQDARAVSLLPGGGVPENFDGESTTNKTPVEDEFLLEANTNILRLRSLRCYYLARMHASPVVHKYNEALVLLSHAESLAKEACEEIGACDRMEGGDALLENLEHVMEEMKGEKCRVIADLYLNKDASSISEKCLLERLFDYDIPPNSAPLAHVPPKLIPMACKPSFFDVALNYVSAYPVDELERALEGHRGAGSSTKSFLGWLRR